MTIPATVMVRLATLGLSGSQAEAVADMLASVEEATARTVKGEAEAVMEEGRQKGRERWRRWKENHSTNVSKRLQPLANNSRGGDARGEDKTSTQKIEPQEQEGKKVARAALDPSGFDEFWSLFPNKVGKAAARKEWPGAVAKAGAPAIMAGLRRYASKADDRPWCNPSTFLHQERWADEPAQVVPMARGSPSHRPPTAQEILKARRESYADDPEPRTPRLIAAG